MSKRRLDREPITARTFLEPLGFLLPFLVGLAVFTVYPFINVFVISLKENYSFMTGSFSGWGLGNFVKIFSDPNFLNALRNTWLYVLFVVPIATVLSLLMATLLNGNIRLKGLFQHVLYAHGNLHNRGWPGLEMDVQFRLRTDQLLLVPIWRTGH